MKKELSLILSTVILSAVTACGVTQQNTPIDISNVSSTSSSSIKETTYPFDVNKDFFPLYNQSYWKYEVFDSKNKLISTLTKTLDATNNESSIEIDNKNKYYVTVMKKEYSNTEVKDKATYEYIRRKDNQLAFGKFDNLTYYPSKGSFDPYAFRPYIKFESNKLETVKVKAGSFQCLKTEFTLGMDKYTIWYAKGIGEVKRVKEEYFNSYTYALSEYSNSTAKQFVIRKENIDFDKLPKNVVEKAESAKVSYLKINQLPSDLFETKVLTPKVAYNDFVKNAYEINYSNRGISLKEVLTLKVLVDKDGNIKDMVVTGDGAEKPTYNGKLVDKLPTLL